MGKLMAKPEPQKLLESILMSVAWLLENSHKLWEADLQLLKETDLQLGTLRDIAERRPLEDLEDEE